MHPVECANECGLPTPRGANERGDRAGLDRQRDIFYGFELSVVDAEIFYFNTFGHDFPLAGVNEGPWAITI